MRRLLLPALAVAVSGAVYWRQLHAPQPAFDVVQAPAPPAAAAAAPPPAAPAPAPAPPPAAERADDAAPAPTPPDPAGNLTRVYGVVYDLLTKKAIPGALLKVSAPDAEGNWSSVTDEKGHYSVDVPGWMLDRTAVIMAEKKGYRPGQIEDQDPPLGSLSLSARRARIEETTDYDLAAVPVRRTSSSALVRLDLVMVHEK